MRTVLALSPHLDDAVFSIGGFLFEQARGGARVIVATLFAGGVARPKGFALACQLDKGLGPDVDYMALRRREDVAAVASLGARALHLPLLEAPHRGYADAAALFDRPRTDDDAREALACTVRRLRLRLAPDLTLAPLGVGGHVDHVLLREAAERAERGLILWEDWPYARRAPPLRSQTARAFRLKPDAADAKRRACRLYASQIGFQFGSPDALDQALAAQPAEWLHAARDSGPLPLFPDHA